MKENDKSLVVLEEDSLEVQRKYAEQIVRRFPGLGEKSAECAKVLVNSGVPPRMALEIIHTVYQPEQVRGQGNRVKFFTGALVEHYGPDFLEKASRYVPFFSDLVTYVGEVEDLRTDLNEEGLNISYKDATFLRYAGLDSERIFGLVEELRTEDKENGFVREGYQYVRRIVEAARQSVKTGHELESHLNFGRWSSLDGLINSREDLFETEEND